MENNSPSNHFSRLIQEFWNLQADTDLPPSSGTSESASPAPSFDTTPGEALSFEFELEGVAMKFVYLGEIDPDCLRISCSFGQVPKGNEELLHQLLEMNYGMNYAQGRILSINPRTQMIEMATNATISSTDAHALWDLTLELQAAALEWRSLHPPRD